MRDPLPLRLFAALFFEKTWSCHLTNGIVVRLDIKMKPTKEHNKTFHHFHPFLCTVLKAEMVHLVINISFGTCVYSNTFYVFNYVLYIFIFSFCFHLFCVSISIYVEKKETNEKYILV